MDFIKKIICILIISSLIINSSYISSVYASGPSKAVYEDSDDINNDGDIIDDDDGYTRSSTTFVDDIVSTVYNHPEVVTLEILISGIVGYKIWNSNIIQTRREIQSKISASGWSQYIKAETKFVDVFSRHKDTIVRICKNYGIGSTQMKAVLEKSGLALENEVLESIVKLFETETIVKTTVLPGSQSIVDTTEVRREVVSKEITQETVQNITRELEEAQKSFNNEMVRIIDQELIIPTKELRSTVDQLRAVVDNNEILQVNEVIGDILNKNRKLIGSISASRVVEILKENVTDLTETERQIREIFESNEQIKNYYLKIAENISVSDVSVSEYLARINSGLPQLSKLQGYDQLVNNNRRLQEIILGLSTENTRLYKSTISKVGITELCDILSLTSKQLTKEQEIIAQNFTTIFKSNSEEVKNLLTTALKQANNPALREVYRSSETFIQYAGKVNNFLNNKKLVNLLRTENASVVEKMLFFVDSIKVEEMTQESKGLFSKIYKFFVPKNSSIENIQRAGREGIGRSVLSGANESKAVVTGTNVAQDMQQLAKESRTEYTALVQDTKKGVLANPLSNRGVNWRQIGFTVAVTIILILPVMLYVGEKSSNKTRVNNQEWDEYKQIEMDKLQKVLAGFDQVQSVAFIQTFMDPKIGVITKISEKFRDDLNIQNSQEFSESISKDLGKIMRKYITKIKTPKTNQTMTKEERYKDFLKEVLNEFVRNYYGFLKQKEQDLYTNDSTSYIDSFVKDCLTAEVVNLVDVNDPNAVGSDNVDTKTVEE